MSSRPARLTDVFWNSAVTNERSTVQPGGPAVLHRPGLARNGINAIATKIMAQIIALQQMGDPAEFRMQLVQKLAGFEANHFKAGIRKQMLDFHGNVFAVVAGLGLLAFHARPDIGREE